eukprot:jgi/Bigna1/76657/fgenesh1_pg.42_\
MSRQEQKNVFDHFLISRMSVRAQKPKFIYQYSPNSSEKFPEDVLDFLYPEGYATNVRHTEHYAFVMTRGGGEKEYGFCNRRMQSGEGSRFPEVMCILSKHPYYTFFKHVLQAVQARWVASADAGKALLTAVANGVIKQNLSLCRCKLGADETLLFAVDHPIDYPFMREDYSSLLRRMKPDDMLMVFNAMLQEKRIVVLSESLPTLSNCMHALVSLLYPLTWEHIFIPILPPQHIRFACAPMPFLVGMHRQNLQQLAQLPLDELCLSSYKLVLMVTAKLVVLVDVDAPSIQLLGDKVEEVKKILPRGIDWKAPQETPLERGEEVAKVVYLSVACGFVQSCFTAFFAVLFSPCNWYWTDDSGGFDIERHIRHVEQEATDLVPCFKALRHSQMFEAFTCARVERERKGKSCTVKTFDMLVEMSRSNPTSFKLALKNILMIHSNRYKANRFLPPLPKNADLMRKLAHSTISTSKTMAQKAKAKLGRFREKFASKVKSLQNKLKKPSVSAGNASAAEEEDDDDAEDEGSGSRVASPKSPVVSPGSSQSSSSSSSSKVTISPKDLFHRITELRRRGFPPPGFLLEKQQLQSVTHMPDLYETAMEFTSNNPEGKRKDGEMLRELSMGSAHSVGAKIIADVIFERLRDCKRHSWRHATRALEILLHLLAFGGDIILFHAMEQHELLQELKSSYRHSNQTYQGLVRELAERAYRYSSNVFSIKRLRRYRFVEDASKIYMAPPIDPWLLKSAPKAEGGGVTAARGGERKGIQQGRGGGRVIYPLKEQSISNIRTQTLIDGKGLIIPPFAVIHSRLEPLESKKYPPVVVTSSAPPPAVPANRRPDPARRKNPPPQPPQILKMSSFDRAFDPFGPSSPSSSSSSFQAPLAANTSAGNESSKAGTRRVQHQAQQRQQQVGKKVLPNKRVMPGTISDFKHQRQHRHESTTSSSSSSSSLSSKQQQKQLQQQPGLNPFLGIDLSENPFLQSNPSGGMTVGKSVTTSIDTTSDNRKGRKQPHRRTDTKDIIPNPTSSRGSTSTCNSRGTSTTGAAATQAMPDLFGIFSTPADQQQSSSSRGGLGGSSISTNGRNMTGNNRVETSTAASITMPANTSRNNDGGNGGFPGSNTNSNNGNGTGEESFDPFDVLFATRVNKN